MDQTGAAAAQSSAGTDDMVEFQNQLKALMLDLKEGMRQLKTELKNRAGSPSERIVGLVSQLDKTNNRFFKAATRAQTAPQISLYDGSALTAIIRASAESNRDAATAGGHGERGVVISRAASAGKDATLSNDMFTSAKGSGIAAAEALVERRSNDGDEGAVPDDGFPTQSKVVFKMSNCDPPKKRTKGQAPIIAPHLDALYRTGAGPSAEANAGVDRPKSKGGADGAHSAGGSRRYSNQNQESGAMFPEVVKTNNKQLSSKRSTADDNARYINKMNPTMRVLLQRTEHMVEDARKKATSGKKKPRKKEEGQKAVDDEVGRVRSGPVDTGYGPIGTIHEVEEDEHEHEYEQYLTDDWDQSAAGGGGSSSATASAAATRPVSRHLCSGNGRGQSKAPRATSAGESAAGAPTAQSQSARSRSPHSRAHSAQGRGSTRTRTCPSTESPSRPGSRSQSRPTITELFAMTPEEVAQQQKLLKEMGWTQQRVNEGEENYNGECRATSKSKAKRKDADEGGDGNEETAVVAHTTLEWQNELARHILSMYATTTAAQHLPESKAILEFVDTKRSGSVDTITDELFSKLGAGDVSFESLVQEEVAEQRLKRAVSKARLLGAPKQKDTAEAGAGSKAVTAATSAKPGTENFSKLETLQPRQHSKAPKFPTKIGVPSHQVVHTTLPSKVPLPGDVMLTRGHDGGAIPARPMGPPKCFPVWFVGTGDVYSDWSAMSVSKVIDGVKLQAQLQVMSENREAWEYLGVVEAVINRYYKSVLEREKRMAEEQKGRESAEAQEAFERSVESRSPSPQRGRGRSHSPHTPRKADRPSTTSPSQSPSRSLSRGKGTDQSSPPDASTLLSSKTPFAEINTEDWGASAGTDFFTLEQPISHESTGMVGADNPSLVTVDLHPTQKDRVNIGVFWLQLISTGVAMATLSLEDKKYDLAMNILQRLERWSTRDDLLNFRQRQIARAFTLDAFAYYFFRRKKLFASLRHTKLAAAIHERLKNNDGIAACLLQVAIVECFQAKFKECHKTIYQFLAMIEDGRFAFQTATPRQLCLVAVGYHNLAVVQLKMQHSDLAARSSQNARKIARLCLSSSTRYLATFQMTHDAAAKDLGFHVKYRPGAAGYGEELEDAGDSTLVAVNRMTEDFFKTVPDMDGESWQHSNATVVPDHNKSVNKLPKLKGTGTTSRDTGR